MQKNSRHNSRADNRLGEFYGSKESYRRLPNKKKAKFQKLEYLYLWKPLLRSPETNLRGEDVFRDVEKLLYKSGLHSKLVREGDMYVLYVRESEYEYAHALAYDKVAAVIGKTLPEYILFKDDFDYKNEKFYQDTSPNRCLKLNARMSMVFMAIAIIVTMIVVYYVRR